MGRYLLVLITFLVGATTASAATWNGFQKAFTSKFMTFFDADTVIKNGDLVTVWIKYVNNVNFPDADGSYSTAQKIQYSCKKRTNRVLSTSTYDREQQFIKSSGPADSATDIAPGTVGESILNVVCTSDFPNNKSEKHYYRIDDNDIFKQAARFFERTTDIAPNTAATWAGFSRANNSKVNYFFDLNTVQKKENTVTIWQKYVKHPKHPDSDGSFSTAQKVEFSCSRNTAKVLHSSTYDKDHEFIESYPKPEETQAINPGTIFHGILTAVCTSDFPNGESSEHYYLVSDNDIYKDAADYFRSEDEKQIDLAPK